MVALSGFFVLVYLFGDEVRRCRTLIRRLTAGQWVWGDQTLETLARQRDVRLYRSGCIREGLARWIGVQLLARRTLVSEKIIYYPSIVLLLLIVAHSGLFDDWRLVPSLIIVLTTGVLVMTACVLFLRISVNEVRESTLASMRTALAQNLRESGEDGVQSLQLMIEEVENERRGAFRPVFSDPIFKALLMPLGGYGSLYLINYLTGFLQG